MPLLTKTEIAKTNLDVWMWRGPVVAEGQTHFPEQRLEGSMMGWPPVLNKHDPPTKCWSKHYNVICGPRCEPQETCGSALFNNTQILIFFWYKKSKLLSESLKSRNYSAIEFSQLEKDADWAENLILVAKLKMCDPTFLPGWEQIWIWRRAKTNICLAHFPILFCQPTLLKHILLLFPFSIVAEKKASAQFSLTSTWQ